MRTTDETQQRMIAEIAKREMKRRGRQGNFTDIQMDVESAFVGGHIELGTLLYADDCTFGHDMNQIDRHIDRQKFPGKFPAWFCPRTAPKE